MKKLLTLLLMLLYIVGFSQQKSTGDIILTTDMTANLTLDNSTKKATLEITGPSDVWFGLHFGHFIGGQGMRYGDDLVYTGQNTVIDGNFAGGYRSPNVDAINNWDVLSDVVLDKTRKIRMQRDFVGDSTNDFNLDYTDETIDFAWAKSDNLDPSIDMNYHGDNFGWAFSNSFSTLGVEDFTLRASEIYPNPANDKLVVKTKSTLRKISIYSQLGVLVKIMNVNNNMDSEIEVKEFKSGIYLIELQNDQEKIWKKVIIN